jgi:hypothetical protein
VPNPGSGVPAPQPAVARIFWPGLVSSRGPSVVEPSAQEELMWPRCCTLWSAAEAQSAAPRFMKRSQAAFRHLERLSLSWLGSQFRTCAASATAERRAWWRSDNQECWRRGAPSGAWCSILRCATASGEGWGTGSRPSPSWSQPLAIGWNGRPGREPRKEARAVPGLS